MIIRTASAVSCFVAVVAAASLAQAQAFTPVNTAFTVTDSAFVVEQTQQLNCHIDGFSGTTAVAGGSATIFVNPPNTLLEGDSLCDNVGLNSSNWVITRTGPGTVSVSGIVATTLLGSCSGTVVGTFSGSTLTLVNQPLAGTVFGFPMTCTIDGYATVSPTITMS